MPFSPSTSLATLRPDLAASFEAFDYEASQKGFIATKVLPISQVASQLGVYGYIPPEQLLIQHDTTRAPGSSYNRGQATFTTKTFVCKENGWEEAVDDREANAYKNYFDTELLAARRARDTVLRNLESRIITKLTDTAVFTGALTGTVGTTWKTFASADPVSDIVKAQKAIYANSGCIANSVTIGWNAYQNLRRNASIQSQIKFSGLDDPKLPADIFLSMLAALFNVKSVNVAGAQYASNNQGQVLSLASLWADDSVLVAKVADSEDFREVCLGRVFHWAGDGSSENGTVESYRDESRRADVIRVRMDSDEQVIYPQAGYLLTGANA